MESMEELWDSQKASLSESSSSMREQRIRLDPYYHEEMRKKCSAA
jgi:hypothetical protein